MPSFGVALAWMIISPVAFLTDLTSVLIMLHYKPLFHSCDVALISILVTMTTNSCLLLPVPAVVRLGDLYWTKNLCMFYTWLSITLRSSHLLVLLVLNVYWMASLRMSHKGRMFASSKPMKVSVCCCWFTSAIAGLIPVSGGTDIFNFYQDNICAFLPANIGSGFAIFFIIASLLSAVMGVISTLDTLMVLRSMKYFALSKYSATRFRVPTVSGGSRARYHIQSEHSELTVSIELCRLVLCFSVSSAALNAFPLMISQFVQLVQTYDRQVLETTLLWLLLVEASTLPHILWSLSGRYRHAAVYTWRVFVVRDRGAMEGDTAACTLQAYRFKVKDTGPRASLVDLASLQVNGTSCGASGIDDPMANVSDGNGETSNSRTHGTGQSSAGVMYSTDLGRDVTLLTSSEVVSVHHHHNLGLRNQYAQNGCHVIHNHVLDTPLPSRSATHELPMTSFRKIPSGPEIQQRSEFISCKLSQQTSVTDRQVLGARHSDLSIQPYHPIGNIETYNATYAPPAFSKRPIRENITTCLTRRVETRIINWAHCHYDYNSSNLFNEFQPIYWNDGVTVGEDDGAGDTRLDCRDNINYPVVPANLSELSRDIQQGLPNNQLAQSQTIILCPTSIRVDSYPNAIKNHNCDTYERVLGVYYDDTHTIFTEEYLSEKHFRERHLVINSSTKQTRKAKKPFWSPGVRKRRLKKFMSFSNLVISKVDDEFVQNGRADAETAVSEQAISESGQNMTRNKLELLNCFQPCSGHDIRVTLSPAGEPNETSRDQPRRDVDNVLVIPDVSWSASGRPEPVGGSELLHLKIRSIRAAMAVYCSDDTTSDEWDIDTARSDNDT